MMLTIKEIQEYESDMLKQFDSICTRNGINYYCVCGTALGAIRHNGPIPWDDDTDVCVPQNEFSKCIDCLVRELPNKYYIDYYKLDSKSYRKFPRIGLKGCRTNILHVDIFCLIGMPNDTKKQKAFIDKITNISILNRKMSLSILKQILLFRFKDAFIHLKNIKNKTIFCEQFEDEYSRYNYDDCEYVLEVNGKSRIEEIFDKSYYGTPKRIKYNDYYVNVPEKYDDYLKQWYGDYLKYPNQIIINDCLNKKYDIQNINQ